jgi:hypothetical protein
MFGGGQETRITLFESASTINPEWRVRYQGKEGSDTTQKKKASTVRLTGSILATKMSTVPCNITSELGNDSDIESKLLELIGIEQNKHVVAIDVVVQEHVQDFFSLMGGDTNEF